MLQSRKNKIVFVSGAIPPAHCGVGDYTHCLMNSLADAGYEVHVITDMKYHGCGKENYIIHAVVRKWWGLSFYKDILRELKSIGVALVHIQYPTIEYSWHMEINLLPILLKIKRYKVVYTIHEYSQRPLLSRIRRWPSVAFANLTIVVEKQFEKDLKKLFKGTKIITIQISANIPHSTISLSEKKDLKRKLLRGYEGRVAAYFGFINPNKVFDVILMAMHELKINRELWFKLLVISEITDHDPYHRMVKTMINELQLQDDVIITGYIANEQVGNYISICDFAISLFEKGLSARNGSFLALRQENIPVISTSPRSADLNLCNTLYVNNDKTQLVEKLMLLKCNLNNSISNNVVTWEEIAMKHIGGYNSL